LICPICRRQYDTVPKTCTCGTLLILDEGARRIWSAHAGIELKRNTKGLAGFGCLTLYFCSGICFGIAFLFAWIAGEPHSSLLAPLFFFALFGSFAVPFGNAAMKRWKRRKYYQWLIRHPPAHFPPRAPGLSDRQYQKEIDRLNALTQQIETTRLASGEIETVPIEPLPEEVRAQHVWIPGLPGYGKSTLMHWMIVEDITQGKGLTVIDPAGDLVGNGLANDEDRHIPGIVDWIPEERVDDTIYLDLKNPVPIDFFAYANEDEKLDLAGNLVDLFNRLGEMFGGQVGVRFTGIVRDIVHTLFEAKDAGFPTSFLDIYDFIRDPDRREAILRHVSPRTRALWEKFPNDEKTEPIISRLVPIARNSRLRTMFGTPNARLKIADVMNEKSILLVNIGGAKEAGIILGTIILSQLLQAAMRRFELPKHRRVPHHCYVDEFQNFEVGSDMAKILTQCRKYNLCLAIANQYTAQLPSATLSAVFGGTSTWFLFRLSPQDIPLFPRNLPSIAYQGVYEKRHPDEDLPSYLSFLKDKDAKPQDVLVDLKPLPFDPRIIAQLQVGEAIHRKADATAQKVRTFPMGERPPRSYALVIRQRTMERYGAPPPPLESKQPERPPQKPEDIAAQRRKTPPREKPRARGTDASG
jgi:hypothetical protein